jgi:hypothetical protein
MEAKGQKEKGKPMTEAKKDKAEMINEQLVLTGKVRVAFVDDLFELKINKKTNERTNKYGVKLYIDKKDGADTIKLIKQAQVNAVKVAFGSEEAKKFADGLDDKFGEKIKGYKNTLHDGDDDNLDIDKEKYPENIGSVFLSVNTKKKPKVIIRKDGKPHYANQDEVKSGDYALVSIFVTAYESELEGAKVKTISTLLDNIMFIEEGEALGGGSKDPSEIFGAIAQVDDSDLPTANSDDEDIEKRF